jgi:DNA polymerase-3 subunit alpha
MLGQVMAGYSLGAADLRIRKVLGKKLVQKIPEIRNEFIYGKKSLYDADHNVIGISEEPSDFCKGAIANGFSEETAIAIFDAMAEFAKYSFNKAHAGAYAAMAFKCAWLSYYFPVEWSVACLSTYDDTDKITATLAQCKKRGLKILPPDINKSDVGFTVEKMPDGTKAIRYGLQAIKGVGVRAVQFLKEMRQNTGGFKGFDDFYNKVHDTALTKPILDSYADGSGKKVQNPMKKDVEQALINSGAFDEFDENRYAMMNHYMKDIRREKDYEILIEKDYVRKVKLALEKEYMGSYVSEHPLDPFPYADVDSAEDGDIVETTGIVQKITTKPQKNGKKFATVVIESKDGKERKVMLFANAWEKFKDRVKKGAIIIVIGEVNKQFSNINCTRVKVPRVAQQISDVTDEIEEAMPVQETPQFVMQPKDDPFGDDPFINPVDNILQQYGG